MPGTTAWEPTSCRRHRFSFRIIFAEARRLYDLFSLGDLLNEILTTGGSIGRYTDGHSVQAIGTPCIEHVKWFPWEIRRNTAGVLETSKQS